VQKHETAPSDVAAMIVEAVQGDGGQNPASKGKRRLSFSLLSLSLSLSLSYYLKFFVWYFDGAYCQTEFLRGLREICDEHGIVLILDEIMCGFGRTGKWFGFEHAGIVPDMVCTSFSPSSLPHLPHLPHLPRLFDFQSRLRVFRSVDC